MRPAKDPTTPSTSARCANVSGPSACRAATEPLSEALAHLGGRPLGRDERRAWDIAVGAIAVYRELHKVVPTSDAGGVEWALGPRPEEPGASDDYDTFAAHVAPLNRRDDDVGEHRDDDNVPPAPRSDVASYAHLDDAELMELALDARGSLDQQMRHLEDLGRRIELRRHLISERDAAGQDTTLLREQLEASYARCDEAEARYDELASALGPIEDELTERGLVIDEDAIDADRTIARPIDVEPVMPPDLGAPVDRGGPEIGL